MFPVFIQLLGLFSGLENASLVRGGPPNRLAGLPLPARTQVVVSYVRRDNPFGFAANIVLSSQLDAGTLYTRTERVLARGGWQPVRVPLPCFEPILFRDTSLPPCETELSRTPFFQKDGLTLLLPVPTDGPGGSSRVTLNITSKGVPQEYLLPSNPDSGLLFDHFPQLTAPVGDKLSMEAEAGGREEVSGSATVTTDHSPAQLAEHFAAQLTGAGWRVAGRRSDEGSAMVRLEYRGGEGVYDVRLSVAQPKGRTHSNVDLEATLRTGE